MYDKVKSVLSGILDKFKEGDIPRAISIVQFPVFDFPMNKWSILNRLLCFSYELTDFRGFNQWKEVKRFVKKGEKATYILVPWMKKIEEEDKQALIGFLAKPVFAVEQTEGEKLEYQKIKLPDLPLMDRAKEWGISVKVVSGNKIYDGRYSPSLNLIELATPEEAVFFHELVHTSDHKCQGELKGGQDPLQEIVAELGALALCNLVGKDGNKYLGSSYRYIESYAKEINIDPYNACLKVLSRVDKALNLILGKE